MTPEIFKQRTHEFALRIIRLIETLPNNRITAVIGDQLLRSGTSVAANYRSACRARSRREFIAKLGIVEEECDEALYWLELLSEVETISSQQLDPLFKEGNAILAMTVRSITTARQNNQKRN